MKILNFLSSLPEAWANRYIRQLEKKRTRVPYALAWLFFLAGCADIASGILGKFYTDYFLAIMFFFITYAFLTTESAARKIQSLTKKDDADPSVKSESNTVEAGK